MNSVDTRFEDYIPDLNYAYLKNLDLFYANWNDITFYIEDTNKERYFYNILKKVFPNIKLSKIIALNGKPNVIAHCVSNEKFDQISKKIYLVDLDFDKVLKEKKFIKNLVYLERYSIENYLISERTVREIVRNYKPSLSNDNELDLILDFNNFLDQAILHHSEFAISLCVNMMFQLGIEFPNIDYNKCFLFQGKDISPRGNEINNHCLEVKMRIDVDWYNTVKELILNKTKSREDWLNFIPGKYLIQLLKANLQYRRLINQMEDEVFFYQLTKEFDENVFSDIKQKVDRFLN